MNENERYIIEPHFQTVPCGIFVLLIKLSPFCPLVFDREKKAGIELGMVRFGSLIRKGKCSFSLKILP